MTPVTDIEHWRSQIFSRLIKIVLALGAATALPCIVIGAQHGMWAMIAVDVLAIAWLAALNHFRRLSYGLRVMQFIAVAYFAAIGLMLTVGHAAQVFLIAPPVFAAVLLGMRPALYTLIVSALSMLALGLSGLNRLELDGFAGDPRWLTVLATLNFLFVGAMIAVSGGALLQRLAKSLADLRLFAASLEEGKNALSVVNEELRLTAAAVAQLNDNVVIARVAAGPGEPQPIIFANDATVRHSGYTREELLGNTIAMFIGPQSDPVQVARVAEAMARGEGVSAELQVCTKDATPFWLELDAVPFRDEHGRHTHWVVIGRDVDERKKAAAAIDRLAYYDALTGLPIRRRFMETLDQQLARAIPHGALLFVDLDHFKNVNDVLGHAVGDSLLKLAAARLTQLMQRGDMVARLGGDEFVVLLSDPAGGEAGLAATALARADAICAALADDAGTDWVGYPVSASIGIALITCGGQSTSDLLREADMAMYRAKAAGRNCAAVFEATMHAEVEQRLMLERDLGRALELDQLSMHLQLQVDAAGHPVGAEMLMRWQRADGSMVAPDIFIPVAETTGLIVPLGRWALRQACIAWRRLAAAGCPLPLSVNVSPLQFRQHDFVADVKNTLAEFGMPPGQLILEVTEGLVISKGDETIARMHELAAIGIRFSIDDFGTGYSNLSYLKRMPLYELKIDKSFIRDTPNDPDGTAIVHSVLAMAAHLRLHVVAEGVETQEQAQFLATNGGPGMQGYLFARPMPLDALLAELGRRERPRPVEGCAA